MKVQRKISGNTLIEAEGKTLLEVFEQISALEEIFRPGPCGLCQSTAVGFRTRDVGGIKHYECVCLSCGAAFTFGMRKTPPGALFPQRKDSDGNVKPSRGWAKWTAPTNGGEVQTGTPPADF